MRKGGPLRCNPRKVLTTLQYRKGVGNKNYEDIKIPSRDELEEVVGTLNEQIKQILDSSIESDSMIAERLSTNQRWEVEDNDAGLTLEGFDGVIIRGVMLTDVPQATNPISIVLQSLKSKIDDAKDSTKLHRKNHTDVQSDHQSAVCKDGLQHGEHRKANEVSQKSLQNPKKKE